MTEKSALRRLFRALRAAVPPAHCRLAEQRLADTLLDSDLLRRASVVAGFASVRSEIPTHNLLHTLRERGLTVLLPRVLEGVTGMVMCTFGAVESLKRDRFDIPSPDGPEHRGHIDVVLVPGLAFGRDGSRLGYGGGYYDRFLATAQSRLTAICGLGYEFQIVDSLPTEAHDMRLTHVATPGGLLKCGPGASPPTRG